MCKKIKKKSKMTIIFICHKNIYNKVYDNSIKNTANDRTSDLKYSDYNCNYNVQIPR